MLTLTMIGKEVSSLHRIKEESKEMFNEETAEGSRMDEKHAWDDNLCQEGACALTKFRRFRKIVSLIVSLLIALSTFPPAGFADDSDPTAGGIIHILSDWSGSVFGDLGGNDKLTKENFEITEQSDGTVKIRSSNNRGKIASSTEGIAYYYKEIESYKNYELRAKVTVESWNANNQVSFGIMMRENILINENNSSFTSDYLAVGALDQQMKGFYKNLGHQVKSGYEFTANVPAAGETYDLSLKKTGNTYLLRIGDETRELESLSTFNYIGLYTARNTTVIFSEIELYEIPSAYHMDYEDYEFRAFGSNTSESRNPRPYVDSEEGGLVVIAKGGKIASGDEGLSFVFTELSADANFTISAAVRVRSFNEDSSISTPNQKSFGLMLRDEIGEEYDDSIQTSNYVAVGALDQKIKAFYKKGSQTKLDQYDVNDPVKDEIYELSIRKNGDTYLLMVNGQTQLLEAKDIFTDRIYAGLYAARDADVVFLSFSTQEDLRKPLLLTADPSNMKTVYLVGESLDLSGLNVKTVTQDVYGYQRTEWLTTKEYVVTGFDSSQEGTNRITVHFNGLSDHIDLQILEASVTTMEILYYPAKMIYYPGEIFDAQGLAVHATYNSGLSGILTPDLYTISIPDAVPDGDRFRFDQPGNYTVRVISNETPERYVEFDVTVKAVSLEALEIRQPPAKTQYFIGDVLDLSGIKVYALYDDGSSVRLLRDDFTVSGFDSVTVGDKIAVVTYNGKSASFKVNVKEKEATHLEVKDYPKTTYTVGEVLDLTGMTVNKVYDNGDRELYSAFSLDTSAYNAAQPGVYPIRIIPNDPTLEPIELPVTVREKREYEWHAIRFGQSTSDANNKVTVKEDGTILLEALGGSAGKVTGDHDGISFYYTVIDGKEENFVLSADIRVIEYAKNPHDGQESFGIMARDAIGKARDSSIFASNIAAVGGYSGGTRNDNGTQLFVRTGVESPDGTGSQGIQRIMLRNERPRPENTYPVQDYRLTLAKTNSGFVGKINDGPEAIIYEPDILTVQDDQIYVGFFAARLAVIEVSNIEFEVTSAASDAPRVEPPKQPIEPEVEILSLARTSETDYIFRAAANAAGTFTLNLGRELIVQDHAGEAGEVVEIPVELSRGENRFSLTFIPDDTQLLTSYDKIVTNFMVEVRTYQEDGDIYVSPLGTPLGDGSREKPLDLDTAIDFVLPGQKIIVMDGTYKRNSKLEIKKYNDGRPDAMKMLYAEEGTRPVIDFDKKSEGVVHSGNYWHVKGLDFARSAPNTKGYTLGGSHNIIELNRFYEHGDTGMQISRTDQAATIDEWPSYNLILNNESFDNADPSHNNADGFAAKLTSGVGNAFIGNIARNNIDDGWDLYTKAGQGAIGPVILEYNIAYHNGFLSDGTVGNGDKNGFKLGGEGIHVPHIVRYNIAFENGAVGFTSNSNPGVIIEDSISFNNDGANLHLSTYTGIEEDFQLNGFVSYRTKGTARDVVPERLKSKDNFLFDGTRSVNAAGIALSDENFASLEPKLPFERDENGNLVLGDFLRFIAPEIPDDDDDTQDPTDPTDPSEPGDNDDTDEPTDPTDPSEPGDGDSEEPKKPGGGGPGYVIIGTPTPSTPTAKYDLSVGEDGSVKITVETSTNEAGVRIAVIDEKLMDRAMNEAAADAMARKHIIIDAADDTAAADHYAITIPANVFDKDAEDLLVTLRTDALTMTLSSDMFAGETLDADQLTFNIRIVQPDEHRMVQLADRPAYEIFISDGDKRIVWSHPRSSVRVEIPYKPSAAETNHEFIVVWHIDEQGRITTITNGRYAAETESVAFTTTHFSRFAIAYAAKTFADLAAYPWAKHEIEVMAAKEVIKGVSADAFAPGQTLTRADYALLLTRVFELEGLVDAIHAQQFADVKPGDYYYDAVQIAAELNIIKGTGDGSFKPRDPVTRQDMFVMAARAMQAAGRWDDDAGAGFDLTVFEDHAKISSYAIDAIRGLTRAGLIRGDGTLVRPLDQVSRAEAAVLIYRLYNEVHAR